ncbi:6-phosphogluconolactonase [Aurantiacibacter sediminis]|uniref:6-phosphogluconolactonase n=1 Tax=Aurantiacibacter sediminis TaxID=2793064 RepID=A0ABS0N1K2_9SPHN|nr:6-phosphogluconolactonase [Aurantiacibacter sediminis]MBH5321840.1 6-phosphogluconolactonase [Aurantiacibacter sediminis]
MIDIEYIHDAEAADIAAFLADLLSGELANTDGDIAISVPGGSTPFPIFEELAKVDLAWPRLAIWPGDDRIVPENHPASNTGKIRALFEPLGAKVVTLTQQDDTPHFALVWLGMGADGHIASLFPNTDPAPGDDQVLRRLTPDPLPPEAPFDRITLTMPSLLDTDRLMFVIRGDEKRAVFDAGVAGEHDLPIARLLGARGDTKVICFT